MATQRVQVELDDETIAALDDLAQRQGVTRTEALRRAVAQVRYLAEKEDTGAKITVKESS
jgi:predicted transcriptional regulator